MSIYLEIENIMLYYNWSISNVVDGKNMPLSLIYPFTYLLEETMTKEEYLNY